MHVRGRLSEAKLSETRKHPVLLMIIQLHVSSCFTFTKLAVIATREHVLSVLHEILWITEANSVTCKVISQCFDCCKKTGIPLSQKMADVPTNRLILDQPPLTCADCDFCRHFFT